MQDGYMNSVGVTRHPPWVKRCIPRDAEIQRLFTRLIIFLIWLGDVTMSVYTIQYNTSVTTATYTPNIRSDILAPASNRIPN